MKCSELKPNDAVVFKIDEDGKERIYDGTVLFVTNGTKFVHVCYLDGYRNRDDAIPFEKMIAKGDPNGEYMTFDNISGRSILLEAE